MKLLFLTQVLDRRDAVLGFVPRWIEGLARRVEQLRVVALEVGDTSGLPANVDWREIGRRGVVGRYLRYRRVLHEALRGDGFDAVLAHMVPRYALVAEGPARRAGAGLFLWYTHKGVDARLRRAFPRCDRVFTASAESLRLEGPQKVVTGHGIDLQHFLPAPLPPGRSRLLSVGRMTPAKDPLTAVAALGLLVRAGRDLELELVGGGLAPGDGAYAEQVRRRIASEGLGERVHLRGAAPYLEIPASYRQAQLVINASHTGSVDKVVLEAWASGRVVLSCNESIPALLTELGPAARDLAFRPGDPADLAEKIERQLAQPLEQRQALGLRLRALVAKGHEVEALMQRLVDEMQASLAGGRR